MANSKISALTAASALVGTEAIPVVQGGVTLKLTPAQIKAFVSAGGTVVTSNPVLDLTQTWNSGGVTFTGLNFNVTDTASAAGSLLMDLQVGGVSKFSVNKTGLVQSAAIFASGAVRSVTDSGLFSLGLSSDVILARDAANTLALRNGTAEQAFNIYNTYTDASNYERGGFTWSGNVLYLGTSKAGTGGARSLYISTNNLSRWGFDGTTGNFLAATDNTYDIGKVGADRPRTGYFGTSVSVGSGYGWLNNKGSITQAVDGAFTFSNFAGTNSVTATIGASNLLTLNGGLTTGGAVTLPATQYVGFNTRSSIEAPATGDILIKNWAGTSFGLLQFGGTTSAFPALRRTGAALDVVLADASAYSPINASQFISQTSGFKFNASTLMSAPADGLFRLLNNAGTDFTRLILGPNDTSGIAIKKNGTQVDIRLGDDSTYANLVAAALTSTTFVKSASYTVGTVPSASAAGAGAQIYVSDESGGAVTAFSDATNWRRVTDRAVIS